MFVKNISDCEEFIAGDNTILREILHPAKTDLALRYSLAHAIVKPGNTSRPHRLKTSEVYYIIEGQAIMTIDDEEKKVGPGDTICIPPQAVQYIQNTGKNNLVFICIVDPAWRVEDEEIL